jgi:hypothetical protein
VISTAKARGFLQSSAIELQCCVYDRQVIFEPLNGEEKTLLGVISLISSLMAQLLVRDLEDAVVQALRQKAAEEGTSVEEAHRRILRLALLSKKPKKGFKEFLLEMPEGGDDSIFDRHRSQPREVLL